AEWVPGRSLQILGRRKSAGPMNLEVAIEQDGKTTARNWTLVLKEDAEDLFVGRLWGQCMLERLRSEETAPKTDQERQKLMPAIVALSQEWTLLSPHTALLVMEK